MINRATIRLAGIIFNFASRLTASGSSRGSGVGLVVAMGLLLAGCSSPTGIKFVAPTAKPADLTEIMVATSRLPSDKGDFSGRRNRVISYASYEVSIPPNHRVGQIEWPERDPDPKRHFAVASSQLYKNEAAFSQALNTRIKAPGARTTGGKREAILFVHGYNTDFSEALYRAAQMKHDFEFPFPLTLYSWPSAGKPELYMYDRDSVKVSRDNLVGLIELINRTDSDKITLVAHSLGTELLMESLRQIALSHGGHLPKKVGTVILISPDLDMDVFNNQLAAIKKLPPEFVVFVSQKDDALALSSFLAGDRGRLGNTIDVSKIKRGGIQVIDVSAFEGGDQLNHMTAVTSPSLVTLIKGLSGSGQRGMLSVHGQQKSVSQKVVDTATLPISLVVRTTSAIFDRD
nr:alpha/beta hydrolase [uncultured Cohaesibacter sp.]